MVRGVNVTHFKPYLKIMCENMPGAGKHQGNPAGGGMGPVGYCVCPVCGYREPKKPGVPCRQIKCPVCGAYLVREGSPHHKALTGGG